MENQETLFPGWEKCSFQSVGILSVAKVSILTMVLSDFCSVSTLRCCMPASISMSFVDLNVLSEMPLLVAS